MVLETNQAYHAISDNIEFFAKFRLEKFLRPTSYMFINGKGIIKDITCSCINTFGLDLNTIVNFDVDI